MRLKLKLFALLFVFLPAPGVYALSQTIDPYQWLEDVHGPKALRWVAEQNAKSQALLKADPRYQANFESILEVLDAKDRIAYGTLRRGYVYNFWQDANNPKGIWRRSLLADYVGKEPHWQILLDVDALAKAEGQNWVFAAAQCDPDQRRCLIALSHGGADAVVIREFDLATLKFDSAGFSLPEAKSEVAYLNADTILYATAAEAKTHSGYGRIVRIWRRGSPRSEAALLYEGRENDVQVSPVVFHSKGGDFGLVVRAISFFENEYFAIEGTTVRKLDIPVCADVKGMMDAGLIATLRQDYVQGRDKYAKGGLVAFRAQGGSELIYAPPAHGSIENVGVGQDRIYAAIAENVVARVHVFSRGPKGWRAETLALGEKGSSDIVSTDEFGPEALLAFQNYLVPPSLYFDEGDDQPRLIRSLPARFDASALVTEQFEATSKDGTKIPYFVTRPTSLSGPRPTILYGYGGFEISLTPAYSANFGRLWLGRGGIYVVANIRGGGEFGPAWHDAAVKTHRQRAFDDFAAVAQDLTRRGLTTPDQLGIVGGSNGGLLVATAMLQRPELFGAVVCQVPLLDMLAYTRIGAGASWVAEYGDPQIAAERDYLLSYSPYQNVRKQSGYPAVFFVTATSDDRVTPVHARKMAAKMEEQGHDVLFYENTDGGHSAAADHKQAAEMWALTFVYLAQKLGL